MGVPEKHLKFGKVNEVHINSTIVLRGKYDKDYFLTFRGLLVLTFRHRASCILGQAFHYTPENAFYIFNQQIYFIIWYLLDRASLI